MKKVIALLLITAMLIGTVPITIASDGSSLNTYASKYDAYGSFDEYASSIGKKSYIEQPYTGEEIYLNKSMYDKYGLFIYGTPHDVDLDHLDAGLPKRNDEADEVYVDGDNNVIATGTRGYRYLGYGEFGAVVSNTYYPPDAPPSNRDEWISQYTTVDGADSTWRNVDITLKKYMTKQWLYGNGVNTGNDVNKQYTVETINNTNTMTALNNYVHDGISEGGYGKTKLLTLGGWYAKFSVRTERGRYYQTWQGDGMGADVEQKLSFLTSYTMASDQEFIEIPVSYDTLINMSEEMKPEHVDTLKMNISMNDTVFGSSLQLSAVSGGTHNVTIRVNRGSLNTGINTVHLKGSYSLNTIFANDPTISGDITRDVTITVEEPVQPTATCMVTANPRYKTSSGEDVDVDIAVDVSLYKVTNANVESISITLDGETKTISAWSPGTTFSRTIDGTPFDGDPDEKVTKTWQADVTVLLKDGKVLKADNSDITVVVGEPKPPVVMVNAPKTVKVGDTRGITVRASSVTGSINTLILNDGVSDVHIENDAYMQYNYTFTKEGLQTFTGIAIDALGNSGYGEDETEVLPPTVDAVIHTEGQLKPFRKITVSSSQSDSPDTYPIVDSLTDWGMSDGTITASSGVYNPADPDGHRKFDFGVRSTGTINASVLLKNTLGYQDTASKEITIAPDLPPVAQMKLVNKIYRDPSNANNATISVANESYSPDGDTIGAMAVYYWYDSDNDGDFFEHPHHLAYLGANKPQVDFSVSSVGKYYVRLGVSETYTPMPGMESIAVYGYDNTYEGGWYETENIVEVSNIAPSAFAKYTKEKPIDLTIQLGNTSVSQATLQNYINNTLTPQLSAEGIKINTVNIIDEDVKLYTEYVNSENMYAVFNGWNQPISASDGSSMVGGMYTSLSSVFSNDSVHVFEGEYGIKSILFKDAERTGTTFNASAGTSMVAHDNFTTSFLPYATGFTTSYADLQNGTKKASVYYLTFYGDRYRTGSGRNTYDTLAPFWYLHEVRADGTHHVYPIYEAPTGVDIDGWGNATPYVRRVPSFNYAYASLKIDTNNPNILAIENVGTFNNYATRYENFYFDTTTNQFVPYPPNQNLTTYDSVKSNFGIVDESPSYYNFTNFTRDNDGVPYYYAQIPYADDYLIPVSGVNFIKNDMQSYNLIGYIDEYYARYFIIHYASTLKKNLNSVTVDKEPFYILLDQTSLDPFIYGDELVDIKSQLIDKNLNFITTNTSATSNDIVSSTGGQTISEYTQIADAVMAVMNEDTSADSETLYLLKEDTLKMESTYYDYESDVLYDSVVHVSHADTTYFDNTEGLSSQNNAYLRSNNFAFDKVGRYDLMIYVRDNPVGTNDALDPYRLWSTDRINKTVYVHRKPIADGHLKFNYDSVNSVYNTLSWVDTSYDLDHNVTLASSTKGIAETKFAYRQQGASTWQTSLPSQLTLGTYEFKIRAKDIEGAWSDEVIKTISLTATPPVQFEATLTTADINNPLTAFKTNNYLKWQNVWTRYPFAHHLEMSLWNDGTLVSALPYQWQTNDAGNYIASGNDRFWYDLLFYLPSNIGLTDKTYQARIEAVSELNGERNVIEEGVTIVANQPPTISSSVTHANINEGESNWITIAVDDPDKTNLTLSMNLYKDGVGFYSGTITKVPSGAIYENQILGWANMMPGTYSGVATVSDGTESASTNYSFTVIPNEPPIISASYATSLYEGSDSQIIFSVDDPELDPLTISTEIEKNGTVIFNKTWSRTVAASKYADVNFTLSDLPEGTYNGIATVSDGRNSVSINYTFIVKPLEINVSLLPTDPMAGDKLYFTVTTKGYADTIELILEDDIVLNDNREDMNYTPINYVGNSILFSVAQTLNAVNTLEYIIWVSTPQSVTLTGIRNRVPYTFTIRAISGTQYEDILITSDIKGDVRQTLKNGSTDK